MATLAWTLIQDVQIGNWAHIGTKSSGHLDSAGQLAFLYSVQSQL